MSNYIRRESQYLYLNSSRVRGVQNVSFSNPVNAVDVSSLGADNSSFNVSGPKNGSFTVNCNLVSVDPLKSYTGVNPVDGIIIFNKNNVTNNYGFISGYLTRYSSSCQIGESPKISADFSVFGDVGKISYEEAQNLISSEDDVKDSSSEDLSISFSTNDFSTDHVLSYSLEIIVNRRADYILGTFAPKRVDTNWPISVNFSVTISAAQYEAYNLKNYPFTKRQSNVTLDLYETNKSNALSSFQFEDMLLIKEDYSGDSETISTVTLTYRGFVNSKKYIPNKDLVLFLDAQNDSSFYSYLTWKNLVYNKDVDFYLFNNLNDPETGRVIFGNSSNSYAYSLSSIPHNSDKITICGWFYSSDYLNGALVAGSGLFSWGTDSSGPSIVIGDTMTNLHFRLDGVDYDLGVSPQDNTWVHYAFCLNAEIGKIDLYVNGQYNNTISCPITRSNLSMPVLYIGNTFASVIFKGYIDKVSIYSKILSSEEVFQHYEASYEKQDISYL